MQTDPHRNRTLWLCTVLHAFAHGYQVALIPLYLLICKDLKLAGEEPVTLLVAVVGIASFLPSYFMGSLADRFSRKNLLTIGLVISALAFVTLACVRNYSLMLLLMVVAGLGISFFHPSATALIARLFPEARGKALGRMGIGAGLGFFVTPLYAGWRATQGGWRAPVLELGIIGLAGALLFFILAHDHSAADRVPVSNQPKGKLFAASGTLILFLWLSLVFSLRDFAGSGMATLGSLFLQRAHGFNPKETGLALSAMFVVAMISNPLFGWLSDRGRFRWVTLVLAISGVLVAAFPRFGPQWFVPVLAAYGFFFMASFPMVEAGLMESVHDSVRGRVFGIFITVSGCFGNAAHWVTGRWVESIGPAAAKPESYHVIFGILGCFVIASISGLAFLHKLRQREKIEAPSASCPTSLVVTNPQQ